MKREMFRKNPPKSSIFAHGRRFRISKANHTLDEMARSRGIQENKTSK